MRVLSIVALALLAATPALAGPSWPPEAAVQEATGRAFAAGHIDGDLPTARAACKAVEDRYGVGGGYLAALVERCYADSQDDDAERCLRYERAIRLWTAPPGPPADPAYQETRDRMLRAMVNWRTRNCG